MTQMVLSLFDKSIQENCPMEVTIQLRCTPWRAVEIAENLLKRAKRAQDTEQNVFAYTGVGKLRIPLGCKKYLIEEGE